MTFVISTGDPRFNPREPVTINGYRYVPEPATSERVNTGDPVGDKFVPKGRYVAPPRPAFAAGYAPTTCKVRQEGDEWVCVACSRRWDVDEEKPYCDKDPEQAA